MTNPLSRFDFENFIVNKEGFQIFKIQKYKIIANQSVLFILVVRLLYAYHNHDVICDVNSGMGAKYGDVYN